MFSQTVMQTYKKLSSNIIKTRLHASMTFRADTISYKMPSTRLYKKLSKINYQSEQQESLAEVSYSLPHDEFNRQAFAGLKNKNGFVLKNLPQEFSTAANNLFEAFDDFRASSPSVLAKFTGDHTIRGYYEEGTFLFGSRTGDRHFSDRDKDRKLTHALPAPNHAIVSMQEADDKLVPYQDEILKKVIEAIEVGFGLPKGQFTSAFQGFTTKTSLNHNTPVTQNKLKQWIAKNKLTLTEDGRIESFLAHEDLVPLSLLVYRNNETDGLEIESKNAAGVLSYQPVKLNGVKQNGLDVVVILGRATEILTDGLLKGAPHRVVVKPLQSGETFSRDSLNVFCFVNSNVPLQPKIISPNGPKYPQTPMTSFYDKYSKIYTEAEKKAAVKELPIEQLKEFPTDDEIVIEQTLAGPVYRRR